MEKINIGIVGLGNIGQRHLKLLMQNESVNISAVCDKRLSCNPSIQSVKFYSSFKQLIHHAEIQLIDICTPHALHAQMSIAAMEAGKHVLVEKPMCLTKIDAKQMIAASKKHKKHLIVVKQNRYNKPVQLVDDLFKKNKLGKISEVHCHVLWNRNDDYYSKSEWRGKRKTEAGALFTQGSHFIDLLIHWFGDIKKANTWCDALQHSIQIDDSGNSTVLFQSGTIGKIIWSNNVFQKNYEGSITIFGEKGTVKIGGEYLNKIEYWNVKKQPCPDIQTDEQPNQYAGGYQGSSSNHHFVFDDVVKLLRNNKSATNLVQGEEALKTIEGIEKIYSTKINL